jgi:lipoprotein-anchoring transpeptidase ErfK/SrfK
MARTDLSSDPVEVAHARGSPPRHRTRRHARHRFLRSIVVLGVALSLAVAGLGAVRAHTAYEAASRHILRGVRIAGVDLGGLTRAEAIAAVSSDVKQRLSRPITIHAADRDWPSSAWDLGVRADVEQAVGQAFAVSDSLSWFSRVMHRLRNTPVDRTISLSFQFPRVDAKALVQRIAQTSYRSPIDAAIMLVHDGIVKQHSRPGTALARTNSVEALMAALKSGVTEVALPFRKVTPAVTEATLGKTITVDLTTNTLRLYDGFHVLRTYPVATAKQGFATPVGTWKAIAKVVNPSWTNPDPTGWGAGEPLFIPPGPNNPLGLRAMYLNAPGIRIHGTPDSASIGTYASHGCIRMLEQDVIALYPLVPTGTPVLIYGAPPWGLGGPVGVPGT